jgi:hypothetical protein
MRGTEGPSGERRLSPRDASIQAILRPLPLFREDSSVSACLERLIHERNHIALDDRNLLKFCLLYSPDSAIPLQPDVLWNKNKGLAASLFIALLSPRIVISAQAHAKKEALLAWLPPRLSEVSLDDFPLGIVHDVWMHCSYADRPDKHAIKGAINRLVRDKLRQTGLSDATAPPPARDKPLMLVIVEWFHSKHSIGVRIRSP